VVLTNPHTNTLQIKLTQITADAQNALLLFMLSHQKVHICVLYFFSGNTLNLNVETHVRCMVFEAFSTSVLKSSTDFIH
jgi:hypothetical protein